MSTELSPELEDFVQQRIASGNYRSASDVFREAFKLLERHEQLLAHIDTGTRQLRSGQYSEFDTQSLREFFDDIQARGRQRYEASKKGQ